MEQLKPRAVVLQQIREFLNSQGYLEVETPLLCHSTVPDPQIESFTSDYQLNPKQSEQLYLQTSPEFAMKRLLAAGSGPIYQICKAFRNGESGRQHNPEFTMLEWYRPGFDHHQLMDETDELLVTILKCQRARRFTYQELFKQFLEINPFDCSINHLRNSAEKHGLLLSESLQSGDRDSYLQLLMSHIIEPQLTDLYFVYDFPASQAALAKIRQDKYPVGERFEAYFKGVELCNGFHELNDPDEQRSRFMEHLNQRASEGLHCPPLDEHFLQSLAHLPDCAGNALGVDRLIMLATGMNSIDKVLTFPIAIA